MMTPIIIVVGIVVVFWMGAQYASNRIMNNMMTDLVEIEDLNKWLRVWT
jgi:Na+/H+ antiporter NhaC